MELITIEQLFNKLDQPFLGSKSGQVKIVFKFLKRIEENNNIKLIYQKKGHGTNKIDFDQLYNHIPEMFEI